MNNSKEIFGMALGLSSLWEVKPKEFREINGQKELHMTLSFKKGFKFAGKVGSGFTLLFEAFSMFLIECEMPVSKAAEALSVYPQRIWNIFHYWIPRALKESKVLENNDEAQGYLAYWCDLAIESGIESFIKVVKMIKAPLLARRR